MTTQISAEVYFFGFFLKESPWDSQRIHYVGFMSIFHKLHSSARS